MLEAVRSRSRAQGRLCQCERPPRACRQSHGELVDANDRRSGLDDGCAEKSEAQLRAAIVDAYRNGLISDLREISPISEAGRA
jgi:hypothetical protein